MDKVVIGIATRSREDPQFHRLLSHLDEQVERPQRHIVEGRTVAEARNLMISAAMSTEVDVLAFIDTDEIPTSREWIRQITDFQGADIVAGPVIPVEVRNSGARYLADLEKEMCIAIPQDQTVMLTGNSAWRVDVFRSVEERYGYVYDESFRYRRGRGASWVSYGGEDWDLNLRVKEMGFKVRFDPEAGVYHDYSQITWPVALRKRYQYCVGGAIAYLKNRRLRHRVRGAIRRSSVHVLELPIRTVALLRAILLYYGGI